MKLIVKYFQHTFYFWWNVLGADKYLFPLADIYF